MTRDLEQPQVAQLERGDVNPTFETLLRLARGLWLEFTIDVRPEELENTRSGNNLGNKVRGTGTR